jgi:hypothetical protein
MPKNLLQDMVKIKHVRRPTQIASPKDVHPTNSALGTVQTSPKALRSRYTLWFVATISLVFCLFAIFYLFSKATVTVNPKMQDVILNENFSANKDGGTEILPFNLMVISGEENKTIQTTEEKDVSEKAQGTVLIYNAFSSASQRLSIDTRLEGSNGKIYKTKKAVIVPGMKGSLPGSIEVGIYGEKAGAEYNSSPLDFKIFGFKGTAKYAKFYARSKGEITGGFKGKAFIISDAQKLAAINDLKTTLQTKLFKKATEQIPSGFILFKDAVFLNIDDNNFDLLSSQDNMLPVKLQGTLYGFLFNEEKLTQKIAENKIDKYDGSPVYLPNIRDLTFSLSAQAGLSDKDNISFGEVKNINFNLSGAAKIVWKLDVNKLSADLLGKSKKDFNQILLQYPNINSANLVISPFWKTSLPDKTKNIKVIVNYPK